MSFVYAVIGAGRQGLASAYDFVKFGDASKVIFVDSDENAARNSSQKINELTQSNICEFRQADASNPSEIAGMLIDADAFVSAVPYKFNLGLAKAAIESKTHMTDLGGNTNIVRKQMEYGEAAKEAGITIVPDCGMDPGLNISLIKYLVNKFDEPEEIRSYGAGLPQNPVLPWNYELHFNINGLTNEYYGSAIFLIDGKVAEVPCFEMFEELEFPQPLGKLEAAVTSGGLSTLPYELEGKLKTLTNKTLRYPGHWQKFKAFSDLGLFDETLVSIGECKVSPREFYHLLLAPKIKPRSNEDIGIIKIIAKGKIKGERIKIEVDLIDYYDNTTGFTAMQRLTGWHASAIAILAAQNKLPAGVLSVSEASPEKVIEEITKRGINISIKEGYVSK